MKATNLHNRKMTGLLGFAARSLVSRPWYSMAHTVLLTVFISSFYIMLTLAFLVPPAWSGFFGFFQRGGLEGSTDLLIFASTALLLSTFLIVVLTMRMQVRVSWRSNRDNYRLLLHIGFSSRELRHVLRLEGVLLFCLSLPFATIITLLVYRTLLINWNLHEYRDRLTHINWNALAISLITAALLLEWSRANLVRTLDLKTAYVEANPYKHKRKAHLFSRKAVLLPPSKAIWLNIKNMTRFHTPRQLLADLFTLTITFALVFFIYATKAGIRSPHSNLARELVSSDVSYDVIGSDINRESFEGEFQRLLDFLPDTTNNRFEYQIQNIGASLVLNVPTAHLHSDYIRALSDEAVASSAKRVDSIASPNMKATKPESDNEQMSIRFQIYPSSAIPDVNENGSIPAYVFSDIDYLKSEGIISHLLHVIDSDDALLEWEDSSAAHTYSVATYYAPAQITWMEDLIPSSYYDAAPAWPNDSVMPWFIDPISEQLMPVLLLSEANYRSLISSHDMDWVARIRVDEQAKITFQSVVNRDWNNPRSKLTVKNYVDRRMQQNRINYTLDILFDLVLFFILQLTVIQLIAFTQGQYFVRDKELRLFHQIGITRKQERSIIRHYCLRVYLASMFLAYALTYAVAFFWNRWIQPITAVSISWPIMPLVLISLSLLLTISALTQVKFSQLRSR